ncbi:MAG: hypothetical protein OES32_03795 [Acidobacteriota bacterium]|nr:hypothetical protein [Acidobacteriota bacterium]MDH3522686.1 hypothetical protein [Acidobacteriota bacterium]
MGSEYDPIFRGPEREPVDDLEAVRQIFGSAAGPFTRSPWSWWAWAVLLPAIALLTRPLLARYGPSGAIIGWCAAIAAGGGLEMWVVRAGAAVERTTLATWVLRSQANLSFVAAAVSGALIWWGHFDALPGVWLLVLGHSFLMLGGLAFPPFRRAGWIYQLAGLGALWPGQDGLAWFAAATGLGNLAIGLAVRANRRRR